jgi:hypothetical protein
MDAASDVMTGKASAGASSARARAPEDGEGTGQIVAWGLSWNSLAYLYTLIVSAGVGYLLVHVPFQISDNLGNLLALGRRSMGQLFFDTLTLQGFMRPASWATTKAVFELSGGHYFLAYRTLHIVMVFLLLVALVRLLRVRTALGFGLAILSAAAVVGIHPFHDAVLETELNMKLMLPLICFGAVILADSRHEWWKDTAAFTLAVYALLANELGIVAWVCLVTGYLVGFRGVSRKAVVAVTVVLGLYFVFRFGLTEVGTPDLNERSSGFGLRSRDPDELIAMFGDNPLPFYLYNVVASALSVLLSEPRSGVFVFVRYVFTPGLDSGTVINIVTSLATTSVMVWYSLERWRGWLARDFTHHDRLFLIAVAAIAANAAISYPYTKDVIMSIGAAFYPLAMFAALHLFISTFANRQMRAAGAALVYATLVVVSVGWSVRAASFVVDMRRSAYLAQSDWVSVYEWLEDQNILQEGERSELVDQLRAEMLAMKVPRIYLDPPWVGRLAPH